ncbi:MAG: type II toxin-antitoxin system PemK/MazF family toxin [Calditrichaeota bacterium]|nr:MAG: type II toxin-antitoxin system PemK/MazF family toxin [Calditrichota bacterium]MBL1205687.1 type II toxin-antitoxin system PemK/MazF family toxin [Calditrichota bacterium]NOG45515.1 hypothetical protein [Calditrichota bacterium]
MTINTKSTYTPERGHFILLDFMPSAGVEIDKRRPALVISASEFNVTTGLVLVCPITSTIRENPFNVTIPNGHKVQGEILSHQVKTLDWESRRAELLERAPKRILNEVLGRLMAILNN